MWPRIAQIDEKTTRAAKDQGLALARETDRGRVNGRHHFGHVVHDQAVKQVLVSLLQ